MSCVGLCVWCVKPQKTEQAAWRGRQMSAEANHDGPRQVSKQDIGFSVLTVSSVAALYL